MPLGLDKGQVIMVLLVPIYKWHVVCPPCPRLLSAFLLCSPPRFCSFPSVDALRYSSSLSSKPLDRPVSQHGLWLACTGPGYRGPCGC